MLEECVISSRQEIWIQIIQIIIIVMIFTQMHTNLVLNNTYQMFLNHYWMNHYFI